MNVPTQSKIIIQKKHTTMKALKDTNIATASSGIRTGEATTEIVSTKQENNKEVKKVQVDLISMTDKKGMSVPTQG